MTTDSIINVIPTTYDINNCILIFSFPAKPTYSRTIMGRSKQQQQQQQVRSSIGRIRLTGAPRPPLKVDTLSLNRCGLPISKPRKSTKKLRIMWRPKRRSRYAKAGFKDYDRAHERLASTITRLRMCSLGFCKAFIRKYTVKPSAGGCET
ncbi:hypothetical protein BJX63DRAFT_426628 [Aspergillus granulosus]|uniref:Uncharacterized protein n=1 Tax=Aspergillus granulosus TaxID=176169 RepID=A0ABR4GRI2_9EURO